jgi:hypothetical protein
MAMRQRKYCPEDAGTLPMSSRTELGPPPFVGG